MGVLRTPLFPGSRLPAAILLITLGAGLGLGLCGCGWLFRHSGPPGLIAENRFGAALRPAWGDTPRLLHNAHYFKLMGQPELALKELEAAYQHDPGNLKVVNALAQSYEELGRFEQAQKVYQEALAHHRAHPALSNNWCFSFYLAGQWEQAEACFRQVLSRQPQNTAARNNLGLLLCRRGRLEEARRLWREGGGGEAVAQEMMTQALAALEIKDNAAYAQQPGSGPAFQQQAAALTEPAEKLREPPPPVAKSGKAPANAGAAPPPVPVRPGPEKRLENLAKVAARVDPRPPADPPDQSALSSPEDLKLAAALGPRPAVGGPRASPPAAPAAPTPPPLKAPPLTLEELTDTAIEVSNGAGLADLAAQAGDLLSREGFEVARIGDDDDFETEQTVIYFRPECQRVAQAINAKFFQTARVEQSAELPEEVDVQVVLGRAVLKQPRLLYQLAAVAEED